MNNFLQLCSILAVLVPCCCGVRLRVRRLAGLQGLGVSGGVGQQMQCALSCGLTHAQSWQKVLGLQAQGKAPSQKLSLDMLLGKSVGLTEEQRKTMFTEVCTVYDSYNACIDMCPDDMIKKGISSGLSSLKLLCGPKHEEYVAVMPCLSDKDQMIRGECQAMSDRLTVTSMQLQQVAMSTTDKDIIMQALTTFCTASVQQSRCAMPAVSRACGPEAASLMKDMLMQSIAATQTFLSSTGMQLPKECSVEDAGLPTEMPMQTQIPKPVYPEYDTEENRTPKYSTMGQSARTPDNREMPDKRADNDFDMSLFYKDTSDAAATLSSISLVALLTISAFYML